MKLIYREFFVLISLPDSPFPSQISKSEIIIPSFITYPLWLVVVSKKHWRNRCPSANEKCHQNRSGWIISCYAMTFNAGLNLVRNFFYKNNIYVSEVHDHLCAG